LKANTVILRFYKYKLFKYFANYHLKYTFFMPYFCKKNAIIALLFFYFGYLNTNFAQDSTASPRFNFHFQTTVVAQAHTDFHAPYRGEHSLRESEPIANSMTATLFLGVNLWRRAQLYINPEVAGGKGLSGATGVAGFPNGETFRVGDPAPTPYVARCYLSQDVPLKGAKQVRVADEANQIGGTQADNRLNITVGKLCLADIFDDNKYSHDPRTQLFNWSLMSAGAWDYAADVRGYTGAAVLQYITPKFEVRYAAAQLPTMANGAYLNNNLTESLSHQIEFAVHTTPNYTVRLGAFQNKASMGNYAKAITMLPNPDIVTAPLTTRTKTGAYLNADYQITNNIGIWGRASWNDGQNATWAFTEIDNSLSLGAQLEGTLWHRKLDALSLAVVRNGISNEHAAYLKAGGYGFIIGDGALRYGSELIIELNYQWHLFGDKLTVSPDYQYIINPAYNQDSPAVHFFGLRSHIAF
jgi:high affinity Mn2+ porin